MGSSIVMMWSVRVSLISSTREASEVDFPEPVGPVNSTKPRGLCTKSCTMGGRPSWSSGVISAGISRKAAPIAVRWK